MRQHFYTYPTVVELPGQRSDPRPPLFAVAHPAAAPAGAAATGPSVPPAR